MPLNRYVVRVDPQGQSMAVDILDTSGASVAAYESPQFSSARRQLPATIHTQTDFCLASPGPYDVSCKVGGTEVADAGGLLRVQAGDVPVLVVPDWPRELTASPSAASSWVAVKVTANHAAADHEIVFGDATGGNFNVTAPASGIFVVRNTGASGSAVVLPHAAEHVEGVASKSVGPGQALTFANDGTDWWVV